MASSYRYGPTPTSFSGLITAICKISITALVVLALAICTVPLAFAVSVGLIFLPRKRKVISPVWVIWAVILFAWYDLAFGCIYLTIDWLRQKTFPTTEHRVQAQAWSLEQRNQNLRNSPSAGPSTPKKAERDSRQDSAATTAGPSRASTSSSTQDLEDKYYSHIPRHTMDALEAAGDLGLVQDDDEEALEMVKNFRVQDSPGDPFNSPSPETGASRLSSRRSSVTASPGISRTSTWSAVYTSTRNVDIEFDSIPSPLESRRLTGSASSVSLHRRNTSNMSTTSLQSVPEIRLGSDEGAERRRQRKRTKTGEE